MLGDHLRSSDFLTPLAPQTQSVINQTLSMIQINFMLRVVHKLRSLTPLPPWLSALLNKICQLI